MGRPTSICIFHIFAGRRGPRCRALLQLNTKVSVDSMLFDICPFRVVANFGNHGCGKGAENQICIVAWMTMGVVRDIAVKPSRTALNSKPFWQEVRPLRLSVSNSFLEAQGPHRPAWPAPAWSSLWEPNSKAESHVHSGSSQAVKALKPSLLCPTSANIQIYPNMSPKHETCGLLDCGSKMCPSSELDDSRSQNGLLLQNGPNGSWFVMNGLNGPHDF